MGRDGHCLVHDPWPWLRRGVDAVQDADCKDSMMRVLHLVLAPRLSGAEVLAKDLAIDQSAEGMAVCVASLLPAHAEFLPLQDELQQHGVQCWFPPRRHAPRRQTVESVRHGAAISPGRDFRARHDPFVLCARVAAARAGRVRHAFGDQRLRAAIIPARRAHSVRTCPGRDQRVATRHDRLRAGHRTASFDDRGAQRGRPRPLRVYRRRRA